MRLRLCCLILLIALPAFAEDWPQWRGPHRDGVSTAFREPKTWPERLQPVWKQEVGIGYSNPLVIGARVYLHTRQGGNEVVAAFDLESGKQICKQNYPA